jgi:amidohydrolase
MQSRGNRIASNDWRRDFHQHPELEIANSKQQRKLRHIFVHLGEVQTGVAKTGVVGILKGGKPGPVVAWADIDALPVKKELIFPLLLKQKVNTMVKVSNAYARLWS